MNFDVRLRIDCESQQKAVAVRDKLAAVVGEDPEVVLMAQDVAQQTRRFTVTAVDTDAKEVITEQVEATHPDEAKEKVETSAVVVTNVT